MTDGKYVPTIGLEIHAELLTASKMFCSCRNNPDEEKPNLNICPICLGHPGTLPILNKEAIRHILKIGTAVNGKLADFTEWDRKNYFYPDIPKGYQISQYIYPLVEGGELSGVAIERIHLEEDTAQSTHDTHDNSLINFNRSGVPLMELVTKPVIHDASTAVGFAKELQLLLRYFNVGRANMEKGEMRIEANISVATADDTTNGKFGTKTEVKNLNSFRSVERAIAYEIDRQASLLASGEHVVQETRGWDDRKNETYSQRSKESSHDYRYFPEPDIPKLKISEISEFSQSEIGRNLVELPSKKRERFSKDYAMTDKEVSFFVESPKLADYYESIIAAYADDQRRIKLTTNYFLTDYIGLIKKESPIDVEEAAMQSIPASNFAELITMINNGDLSSRGAKDLLPLLIKEKGSSPRSLALKHSLIQKSDAAGLDSIIDQVISANEKVVAEYKGGKGASLQYLIGQAMKAAKGSANPTMIKELLEKKLSQN